MKWGKGRGHWPRRSGRRCGLDVHPAILYEFKAVRLEGRSPDCGAHRERALVRPAEGHCLRVEPDRQPTEPILDADARVVELPEKLLVLRGGKRREFSVPELP